MIRNYFENVQMSSADLKSMRNSLHGSLTTAKPIDEFAKMTPSGSMSIQMRQSMKNSRFFEEESTAQHHLDFFRKEPGLMVSSEVVEKTVVSQFDQIIGAAKDSMVKQPEIMVKKIVKPKPPTPKKKEQYEDSLEADAIARLQKQVEILTQTLLA